MKNSAADITGLWENMTKGNSDAMLALYEYYYNDLLSYGIRLCGSLHTAKDAINDVFLHLAEQHKNLKPVKNVKAYLFACIRRKVFYLLYAIDKMVPIDEASAYGDAETSYEEMLVAIQQSDDIRTKIQLALAKLTERQKELIQLKYFQNLNYRQIETVTGISVKTAYNTIYNALRVLETELRGLLFSISLLFSSFL